MSIDLTGQAALVTGATRGIGRGALSSPFVGFAASGVLPTQLFHLWP